MKIAVETRKLVKTLRNLKKITTGKLQVRLTKDHLILVGTDKVKVIKKTLDYSTNYDFKEMKDYYIDFRLIDLKVINKNLFTGIEFKEDELIIFNKRESFSFRDINKDDNVDGISFLEKGITKENIKKSIILNRKYLISCLENLDGDIIEFGLNDNYILLKNELEKTDEVGLLCLIRKDI